jgi:hypothetical protein
MDIAVATAMAIAVDMVTGIAAATDTAAEQWAVAHTAVEQSVAEDSVAERFAAVVVDSTAAECPAAVAAVVNLRAN